MYRIKEVGGAPGGEAFLIMTGTAAALLDSGFSFSAGKMIENIKKELRGRPLDYVLLTHSHYDHASGSAYVRDAWPNAIIAGSAHAAGVFKKPSAVAVMREMNDNAASLAGVRDYEDKLDSLRIDRIVGEGDIIDLGPLKFRVIEAPGHTQCSIAFFEETEKLLLSCETLGVRAARRMVAPAYLVGYQISMESNKKLAATGAQSILVPHQGILEGKACAQFIEDALYWNEEVMRRVTDGYRAGKTIEQLAEEYTALFYTPMLAEVQPKKAFLLNLSYMLPMLLQEM